MKDVVVYGIPGSPFLRSVLIAVEEKSVPYQLKPMKPGDQRNDEYLKLHPFGRVPAIKHGDFALYETQAILRYLDAAFPNPSLQPKDAPSVGRVSQIMSINDWYLFPQAIATIAFQRIVGPLVLGLKTDEAIVANAVPDMRNCLAALDCLIGNTQFLVGNSLSIADIMLAPHIDFLAMTPEGAQALEDTALGAWIERMQERPSLRKTQPADMMRRAA